MQQAAANRYYETQIKTATPEELTMMLYNGCIRFLKQAMQSMSIKDYAAKNKFISKALDIVDELHATLDMQFEIAENLSALYVYFKDRLLYSSMQMDMEVLQEVTDMMTELRDTWYEAMNLVKQK